MKTAKEILGDVCPNRPWENDGKTDPMIIRCMKEYASEYQCAYEKILEEKATDVSFHYADLEKETTEKIKDQVSDMIYHAIPTGEVDAFTLIKVLKKLKSDVEAI